MREKVKMGDESQLGKQKRKRKLMNPRDRM